MESIQLYTTVLFELLHLKFLVIFRAKIVFLHEYLTIGPGKKNQ